MAGLHVYLTRGYHYVMTPNLKFTKQVIIAKCSSKDLNIIIPDQPSSRSTALLTDKIVSRPKFDCVQGVFSSETANNLRTRRYVII